MTLMDFDIDLSKIGDAKVVIDGEDLSAKLSRVIVDTTAGEVPKVYLEGNGRGPISGTGKVFEVVDQSEAIAQWLSRVDAERLERESLEGLGLGLDDATGPQTTGEAIIAKLIEWARADIHRS